MKLEAVKELDRERERPRLLCSFLQWVYSRPSREIKPETAMTYLVDVRAMLKRDYNLDMGTLEEAKRLAKGLSKDKLARRGGLAPPRRHPITKDHLIWWTHNLPRDFGGMWGVSRTTFLAASCFLHMSQYRGGEVFYTGGVSDNFNKHLHLSWNDISLRDHNGTAIEYTKAHEGKMRDGWSLAIRNPVTKTDQLRSINADEPVLLPFSPNCRNAAAWMNWKARETFGGARIDKERPLFTERRGRWLARDTMAKLVKEAIETYARAKGITLKGTSYGLHSFRIGGGSAMAATGASDRLRQKTSRRKSPASLPIYERSQYLEVRRVQLRTEDTDIGTLLRPGQPEATEEGS